MRINFTHSCGANYKYVYFGPNKTDWINVPHIKRFIQKKYYYKTLLHEISHCMLERLTIAQQIDNSDDEEIVAELSAMIICLLLGLNTWDESFKYFRDYIINSEGYITHEGRREYIKKSLNRLLQYVLKLK